MDDLKTKLLRWIKIEDRGYHTKCWIWQRGKNGAGYGSITWRGQPLGAHRASWAVHVGPIPEGLWVCHRCDQRECIRPSHLWLGTPSDNFRDMLRKRGNEMTNYWADLTQKEKAEIVRDDCLHNRAQSDLAAGGRFSAAGLSKQSIVGASGGPTYPRLPASSPWSGADDREPGDRLGPTPFTSPFEDPWHEPPAPVPLQPQHEPLPHAETAVSAGATLPISDDNSSRVTDGPFPGECYSTVTVGSPHF